MLTDIPDGWDAITHSLVRIGDEIPGLLEEIDVELIFEGDGYEILSNAKANQNTCVRLPMNIRATCSDRDTDGQPATPEELFDGLIFVPDIEFNRTLCTAKTKFQDNGFSAKINNNKNIKAFLGVGRSKSDDDITSKVVTTPIDFFRCNTGTGPAPQVPTYPPAFAGRDCFYILDAFKFMVAFITDDEVDVISDTFDPLAAEVSFGLPHLVSGAELRTGSGDTPNISFRQLFQETRRQFNIGFKMEVILGRVTMRIEAIDDLFTNARPITFRNLNNVKEKTDETILYSNIQIGNNTNDDQGCHPNTVRFFTFAEEDYGIDSVCNTDTQLDLSTDFISDSNIIQDVIENNNDSFDDNTFWVIADSIQDAIPYSLVAPASKPFYYNDPLRNDKQVRRFAGYLPGPITKYLDTGGDLFRAEKTIPQAFAFTFSLSPVFVEPVPFQDDSTPPNFDINMNYNEAGHIAGFHYLVPTPGDYSFRSELDLVINALNVGDNITIEGTIRQYRGGLAPGDLVTEIKEVVNFNGSNEIIAPFLNRLLVTNATFPCVSGDRIRAGIRMIPHSITNAPPISPLIGVTIQSGSTFRCVLTETEGGAWQVFDPSEYRAEIISFITGMTKTQWDAIKAASTDEVGYNSTALEELDQGGWVKSIKFDRAKGNAQIDLVTNKQG